IGEWVLSTAFAQAKAWHDSGFSFLSVAVNLSSRQFQQQGLADQVALILRQSGLSPTALELELTESMAMSGDSTTLETLNDLRQ
ncbi:UNVERIFIED_CONTAM: EAL domain-containing protein, partial [Bacteroidetes bacterium 56_B9]